MCAIVHCLTSELHTNGKRRQTIIILKNCRLIPELCEGFESESADIRIENDTIAEILPAGGNYIGEEIIDCEGKTVIPGLFDIHTHLWFRSWQEYLFTPLSLQSEFGHIVDSIHYMNTLMAYGYTSLRDVGNAYNIGVKIKRKIKQGKLIGPDIRSSGLIISPDFVSMPMPFSSNYGMPVNDPLSCRAAVRKILADGSDYIKVYGNFDGTENKRRGGNTLFMDDEVQAIAETVKQECTYFAVHCTSAEACSQAIRFEAGTIEHAGYWNQQLTDELVAKGYKSALVPTTSGMTISRPEVSKPFVMGLTTAYEEGNILIGSGTDLSEEQFLQNPAKEFEVREEMLGFSRIDILKQATINSAKINGTEAYRGSIKVGKKADLAVINGKPDADLSVLHNYPSYVLKDGKLVAREGYIVS